MPITATHPSSTFAPLFLCAALLTACGVLHSAAAQDSRNALFYGFTSCCPNEVVEYDPVGQRSTSIAAVGTADDTFSGIVRLGLLDKERGRIFLIRNNRLISFSTADGSVTEGPVLPDNMYTGYDAPVLSGYDAEENVLYVFVNHWVSEHKMVNKIIALDPASGRFDDVARVGQAVFDSTGFDDFPELDGGGGSFPIWEETDSFASVTGPAVQDYEGGRLFTLRNGRLVTVHVKNGRVEEGPALDDAMLLEYDESQASLYLLTNCCPNRILRHDVETGHTAVLGEVGTSSDAFSASTGTSLYDPFNRRIWLNRNDSLLTVHLPARPSTAAPSAAASSTGAFLAARAPTQEATVDVGPSLNGMRVIGPADASLPVELTRFTAAADGRAAVLTWQTASETNNDGFHIEHRPRDHQRFRETMFVQGQGTTTAPQSYSQRIEGLSPGSHTFRLRQVDTDGTADYSDEVHVEIGLTDAFVLSGAAPNPARQQSVVRLTVREAQEVRVAVYDALGRQVARLHNGPLASGTAHPFALDGAALPSGVYFVRAVGERFSGVRRITLVR